MATQLRRALGLRSIVSTSTGLAFAAIDYLAVASLIGGVAGDSAWLAVVIAGVLLLLVWGAFSELNGLFPTAAAIRLYMAKAMDDRVALTITFTYLLTIVLVVAADAYIVGSAIAYVLGGALWVAIVCIVALLALATLANLRGIRVASGLQDVATYSVLLASAIIAVVALARGGFALRTPLAPVDATHPAINLIEAVALAIFVYSAFEWVTTSAEEARMPRLIPRGMLIALGLLCGVCALLTLGMSHLLTHAQLTTAYPQLFLAEHAAGAAGLFIMLAVTMLTAVNTFNGAFLTASRFMYATAREGSLPPIFARLNGWAAPWAPILALGGASLACAIVVALTGAWPVLVATGAALEAMIYAVAGFCVWRLRRTAPNQERPFRMLWAGPLGLLSCVLFGGLALIASVTVGTTTSPAPLIIIIVAGILAAAYVLLALPRIRRAEAARRAARGSRREAARAAKQQVQAQQQSGGDGVQ